MRLIAIADLTAVKVAKHYQAFLSVRFRHARTSEASGCPSCNTATSLRGQKQNDGVVSGIWWAQGFTIGGSLSRTAHAEIALEIASGNGLTIRAYIKSKAARQL
jgi:hypothetical protein